MLWVSFILLPLALARVSLLIRLGTMNFGLSIMVVGVVDVVETLRHHFEEQRAKE